jgi:hypothetical protein
MRYLPAPCLLLQESTNAICCPCSAVAFHPCKAEASDFFRHYKLLKTISSIVFQNPTFLKVYSWILSLVSSVWNQVNMITPNLLVFLHCFKLHTTFYPVSFSQGWVLCRPIYWGLSVWVSTLQINSWSDILHSSDTLEKPRVQWDSR